ncbi:MAG: glycosyltransferase family 4 protein [Roseitalea sp.]|nr:glycosyltransferase family 4 protein [Roseitalea sp.]MBO6591091.1 glycosyltransferase family 4 protein [Roseitalea sp.]MBO6599651.1 glycosyltransferase family 4 protein [Roseitalea sp.]MBO6613902.1 glycosyltransferase family 4 protein [Roseitalea sp.]MBO6664890.1 glycosyltransferase family 4 protein [Roseitalea sp.]
MRGGDMTPVDRTSGTKKILFVVAHAPSLINHRWSLMCALIAQGHELVVCAPDIADDIRRRIVAIGAAVVETPISRTGLNPLADLRYMWLLIRLLERHNPDLLITFTIKPNIWGAFAGHRVGVPSIAMVTGLGYAFTDSGSFRQMATGAIARLLYRRATGRNRYVVFQNVDDREYFVRTGCLTDSGKAVITNGSGVDIAHYAPAALPAEPVFLSIARLLRNKGVREYAEASVALKRSHPHARFLLVGNWDEGPDGIEPSAMGRWVAGGLEHLGPTDDVRPAIAKSNVFVLPSYREGTPKVVLEAMSMGRSVITTDAPGCRETTIDGANGFIVPVRDTETLLERMRQLADDPALREAFGRQSRQIAEAKYDARLVNEGLLRDVGLLRTGD